MQYYAKEFNNIICIITYVESLIQAFIVDVYYGAEAHAIDDASYYQYHPSNNGVLTMAKVNIGSDIMCIVSNYISKEL